MKRPEQQLHQAVARYLDLALPADSWWTTIGHGWGKLGKATAGIGKSCGIKAGVPDILILYNGTAHFLELKSGTGRLSKVQQAAADAIINTHAHWALCRSLNDVTFFLKAWSIPTRARVAA